MDEGIITEIIMIMVVLAIGFTLIVTLTPFLRSFTAPQAAPLAEVVYTYSEMFKTNSSYVWEGYLYIYDNNPVDIYRITLFSSSNINPYRIIVKYPNGSVSTYNTVDLNLRVGRGLYVIRIFFFANPDISSIGYTIALTGGHTLDGKTSVRNV